MRRRALGLLCLMALVASCGEGPNDPPPAGHGETLVISPGALLLAEPGATQSLQAYAVGADGDSTRVQATFQTSDPGIVSIGAGDIAIGGTAFGSAQIVATSGELTSAPILVLRAMPAAGALLVADSQVIGPIAAVDPAAAYAPGWQYRVRLRGVTPAVGQVVLSSGGAPVGGRVVSAGAAGSDVEVVLALLAIDEMFATLTVNEKLSLEQAELDVPPGLRRAFRVERRPKGGLRLSAREGRRTTFHPSAHRAAGGARIEQEFDLGSFTCKAEVPPGFVFPVSLDVASFELHPALGLDLVIEDATLQRFVVGGEIAPRLTAKPMLTAALEAKAECKVHVATLILPIGGPLSLVIGGQVPLGVGFEIGAKASFGQLGFDTFLGASIGAEFGIDCEGGCEVVADIGGDTPGGYFKPILPNLDTDLRFELSASVFGWGELTIGNRFLEALQFKTVEMKAGLEQKMDLATRAVQASDPAYASNYSLKPAIEAKAGASLNPIANLLRISLATLSYSPQLSTLAQSPSGTFTITPASVAAGDETQVGELATFTVTLPAATYAGAYAIEGIEIRWRRSVGETIVLEPGRPGCTDIAAAQDQLTFTCQTDFLTEHAGPQTFFAFLKTRIFGVPIPVPIEVSPNGGSTLTVSSPDAGGSTIRVLELVGGGASTTSAGPGDGCTDIEDVPRTASPANAGSLAVTCSDGFGPVSVNTSAAANYAIIPGTGAATSITIAGNAAASATFSPSTEPLGGGVSRSNAIYEVTFEIGQGTEVSLAGEIRAATTGSGSATSEVQVSLIRDDGAVVFDRSIRLTEDDPPSAPIPIATTLLLAGEYRLLAHVDARANVNNPEQTQSSSSAMTITLTVSP
jgi:hypothetical protein